MTRFCTLLLILFSVSQANAQQRFYIFIQTETPRAFFVKKDNKVINSSAGGYIILPGLTDANHEFSVGFTNSPEPEQQFNINIKGKDRSYLLKKFERKGWGLFDLQDLSITHALKGEPGFKLKPSEEVSAFTNVLVQASGDSTLKYTAVISIKEMPKPVIKKEEIVIVPQKMENTIASQESRQTEKKDSVLSTEVSKLQSPLIANQNGSTVNLKIEDSLIQQGEPSPITSKEIGNKSIEKTEIGRIESITKKDIEEFKPNQVSKISETNTSNGLGIVYQDITPGGKADTISILIDDLKEEIKKTAFSAKLESKEVIPEQVKSSEEIIVKLDSKDVVINNPNDNLDNKSQKSKEEVRHETTSSKILKFLNIGTKKDSTDTKENHPVSGNKTTQHANVANINGCKNNATDKELSKLRDKMALAVTDELMISEARLILTDKCITSSQVKRLSDLFGTNAGKFTFFKAVYPYVADKQFFYTLQNELTDVHYNSRFMDILQSR